jgi:hypothetical protein
VAGGGGGGAGVASNSMAAPASAEFDLHGSGLQWGSHHVDKAHAEGRYHQADGLKLQSLHMASGKASLTVAGDLLGPKQDARFQLDNFPASQIQPLLQGAKSGSAGLDPMGTLAAKTVVSRGGSLLPGSGASGKPPRFLSSTAAGSTDAPGLSGELFLQASCAGPILGFVHRVSNRVLAEFSGRLTKGRVELWLRSLVELGAVQGTVGGSAAQPQCDVSMRLADGKIGGTALELAEATAAVDAERRCKFNAAARPADAAGHLKLSGSVPLPQPKARDGSGAEGTAGTDGAGEAGQIEVDAAVKDSGMMLLCAAVPGLRWQQGLADITVRPCSVPSSTWTLRSNNILRAGQRMRNGCSAVPRRSSHASRPAAWGVQGVSVGFIPQPGCPTRCRLSTDSRDTRRTHCCIIYSGERSRHTGQPRGGRRGTRAPRGAGGALAASADDGLWGDRAAQ